MAIVILSPEEYRAQKARLIVAQGFRCAVCGKFSADLDFDHVVARGEGGGWRKDDDPRNQAVCRKCHGQTPYTLSKFTGERRELP